MQKRNIDSQVVKLMLIKITMTGILLLMLLIIVAHFLLADKEHPLTIKQGEQAKF